MIQLIHIFNAFIFIFKDTLKLFSYIFLPGFSSQFCNHKSYIETKVRYRQQKPVFCVCSVFWCGGDIVHLQSTSFNLSLTSEIPYPFVVICMLILWMKVLSVIYLWSHFVDLSRRDFARLSGVFYSSLQKLGSYYIFVEQSWEAGKKNRSCVSSVFRCEVDLVYS